MPYSNNNGGGPWGGGGNRGGGGKGPWGGGGGGGGGGNQGPDLDDLIRKGRDQLRVVLGGKGGGPVNGSGGGGGGGGIEKLLPIGIPIALLVGWVLQSVYTVKPEEQSVELFLGKCNQPCIGEPGLNFAFWPLEEYEIYPVTRENSISIGKGISGGRSGTGDQGLMLTGDENIVDIDFQVVWNVARLDNFLFNISDAEATIRAVSESAMREVIARSNLSNIINRDRAVISQEVMELIQTTLDSYESGVNIVRVNFDKADPPEEVIESFRDVQAAEQDRDTAEKQAEAYANQKLAAARGEVAQLLQEAEGYRAQVVNDAKGEAARFSAILTEYALAPEVTRKRLYLETMERVLGDVEKIIIDEGAGGGSGGQGVVPYLPLNELRRGGTN